MGYIDEAGISVVLDECRCSKLNIQIILLKLLYGALFMAVKTVREQHSKLFSIK